MQSDAPQFEPNRDSSVSVATVYKLIAGASFRGAPPMAASVLPCLLCAVGRPLCGLCLLWWSEEL